MLLVRPARDDDCAAMSAVRIASITQLCGPDHAGDPAAIAGWVANKSADAFRALLLRPEVQLRVAELDGVVVGVGAIAGDTITLNYVHPDFRFRGVSKALMSALETALAKRGVAVAQLNSTVTALSFYRALGWAEAGAGTPELGYPMFKRL